MILWERNHEHLLSVIGGCLHMLYILHKMLTQQRLQFLTCFTSCLGSRLGGRVIKTWHLQKSYTCRPTFVTLFCTAPENIWTEFVLFPKAAAAVFPPPVKRLLYHTWQQQWVRQRSQKGKSIHFLQNTESGLPFHPQRDTQIHSYIFCYAPVSVLHFSPRASLTLPLSSSSSTPSPVPHSLNYLPSLLPSQEKLHMGAFESTSLLWSSKEECVASPTLVFSSLLCISGRGGVGGGTAMGVVRADADRGWAKIIMPSSKIWIHLLYKSAFPNKKAKREK